MKSAFIKTRTRLRQVHCLNFDGYLWVKGPRVGDDRDSALCGFDAAAQTLGEPHCLFDFPSLYLH
jgi:hypothetical protein